MTPLGEKGGGMFHERNTSSKVHNPSLHLFYVSGGEMLLTIAFVDEYFDKLT